MLATPINESTDAVTPVSGVRRSTTSCYNEGDRVNGGALCCLMRDEHWSSIVPANTVTVLVNNKKYVLWNTGICLIALKVRHVTLKSKMAAVRHLGFSKI